MRAAAQRSAATQVSSFYAGNLFYFKLIESFGCVVAITTTTCRKVGRSARAAPNGQMPKGRVRQAVPVQMWDGASPVPVQMWDGASPVPVQMWDGASPVLRHHGACPTRLAGTALDSSESDQRLSAFRWSPSRSRSFFSQSHSRSGADAHCAALRGDHIGLCPVGLVGPRVHFHGCGCDALPCRGDGRCRCAVVAGTCGRVSCCSAASG
jgi:hypothetical protein